MWTWSHRGNDPGCHHICQRMSISCPKSTLFSFWAHCQQPSHETQDPIFMCWMWVVAAYSAVTAISCMTKLMALCHSWKQSPRFICFRSLSHHWWCSSALGCLERLNCATTWNTDQSRLDTSSWDHGEKSTSQIALVTTFKALASGEDPGDRCWTSRVNDYLSPSIIP